MQADPSKEQFCRQISEIRRAIETTQILQNLEEKLENLQELKFVTRDIGAWILDTLLDGVRQRENNENFKTEKKSNFERKNQVDQDEKSQPRTQ